MNNMRNSRLGRRRLKFLSLGKGGVEKTTGADNLWEHPLAGLFTPGGLNTPLAMGDDRSPTPLS